MRATHTKYTLNFIRPGGTSRGVLTQKETHLLFIADGSSCGVGECALFRGLSSDDRPDYQEKLQWVCEHIETDRDLLFAALEEWPSIAFGLEQAFRSLDSESPMRLFDTPFLKGAPIPINGLIWMGNMKFMKQQVADRLREGYRCLKFKIGALDFDRELAMLRELRKEYSTDMLEIRVDANGAFAPTEALTKLEALARLDLHSIEQPIAAGNWEEMAGLCQETPLPIALDEELIGIGAQERKIALLHTIRPQYIILKPSLTGGFAASEAWIELARELGIGWWVTSALESNIGLNAIAQWTATLGVEMPQGLGTGSLFNNNFKSPLYTDNGQLMYQPGMPWHIPQMETICT